MISEEKIDNCNDVMVPLLFRAIFQSEGDKTDIEREGGREGCRDAGRLEIKKSVLFSLIAQFESRLKESQTS